MECWEHNFDIWSEQGSGGGGVWGGGGYGRDGGGGSAFH